jgi:hypothetical protein
MGDDFTKIPRPSLSSHKREIRLLRLQLGDEVSNLKDTELLVYLIDEEMDIYIGVQCLAT